MNFKVKILGTLLPIICDRRPLGKAKVTETEMGRLGSEALGNMGEGPTVFGKGAQEGKAGICLTGPVPGTSG